MRKDLFGGLLAIDDDDLDTATGLWDKYGNDHRQDFPFLRETLSVTVSCARGASNYGLHAEPLLRHVVAHVPPERRMHFQRAADTITSSLENKQPDLVFTSMEDQTDFFVSLWNILSFLIDQTAKRVGLKKVVIVEALKKGST